MDRKWDRIFGANFSSMGLSDAILVSIGKKSKKQIIEIRQKKIDLPFPGFSNFFTNTAELFSLPELWTDALKSVGGVYLLVSENGEQYVGSAYGQAGFFGRWSSYVKDGHGGNVLLRKRGYKKYSISILEVASPDMSQTEIIERERHWKNKLGVRVHGLNLN